MGYLDSVNAQQFVRRDNNRPVARDHQTREDTLHRLTGLREELSLLDQSQSINLQLTEDAKSALDSARKAVQIAKRFNIESVFSHIKREFVRTLQQKLQAVSPGASDFQNNLDRLSETISRATANEATRGAESLSLSQLSVSVTVENIELSIQTRDQITRVSMQRVEIRLDYFELSLSREPIQQDPLVFDMDGDGIETLSLGDGRLFDMNADDIAEQTAWIASDDAFLAYDRNGNGKIDDGGELFGDQHGARDGIQELRKFDDNHDGIIDNKDSIYASLQLMFGDDHMEYLKDRGIARINLNNILYAPRELTGGRQVAKFGYEYEDGRKGEAAEILLDSSA